MNDNDMYSAYTKIILRLPRIEQARSLNIRILHSHSLPLVTGFNQKFIPQNRAHPSRVAYRISLIAFVLVTKSQSQT